ncbi:hypothetical protein IWQ56_007236 [Coemansia nantahalensis]|uniref:Uncharacterized protein n=2 Tax=Coemansia TaxID=4863 RepID=A0ACC1LHL9_9FUNG|nr:hypothetical protein IWQ56_007236 [Coemansia nantahalensis]KAJ2775928.1 hypothetical protein IWQ57_000085 [Coemansia nantahalensis]KAJ2807927.1 hypothetical protein H4R21_000280 [Coemansia helicoidea]
MKSDGSGAAVFEELLRHYEGRIGALRQARESLEVARPAGAGLRCRAALALALYQEMVDDLVMGAVFETHGEARQGAAVCALCNSR